MVEGPAASEEFSRGREITGIALDIAPLRESKKSCARCRREPGPEKGSAKEEDPGGQGARTVRPRGACLEQIPRLATGAALDQATQVAGTSSNAQGRLPKGRAGRRFPFEQYRAPPAPRGPRARGSTLQAR